jgi:N-acetylneuraminic acid mutarotase
MPQLPAALSSAGAAVVNKKVYLAGGLDPTGATSGFYQLSLDEPGEGWQRLPSLPVRLSHAVVVAQNDGTEMAVYVIGGRNSGGEISEFFNSVFKYSPMQQKWMTMPGILFRGEAVPMSAGTGFPAGNDRILLFGGDRGLYFNRTERMNLKIAAEKNKEKKDAMLIEKDHFLTNHPGFSRQILSYNTRTGKCSEVGTIPFESPATTVAFQWKENIVIPSGEIRPGVRTDRVILVRPKK